MKKCPICGAGSFDDAALCFGCLHRFDEDDAASHAADDGAAVLPFSSLVAAKAARGSADASVAPTLVIAIQAVRGDDGGVEWRWDVDGKTQSLSLV